MAGGSGGGRLVERSPKAQLAFSSHPLQRERERERERISRMCASFFI